MKILAFAATSSKQSINKQLIRYAAQLIESGLVPEATVETIDLNDYEMPIFSIDRENDNGIHELAHAFFEKIGQADGVLISFAEHNGSYTAAYKNIFDWASRIDIGVYQNKPTVMLSTSPGPRGAGNTLQAAIASAPFFGNDLKASLSIPSFGENFDSETGSLSNSELDAQLRDALAGFAAEAEVAA